MMSKYKYVLLVSLILIVVFATNNGGARYTRTIKLSNYFVSKIVVQITELNDCVINDEDYTLEALEDDEKELLDLAYDDGLSNEETELIEYMKSMRHVVYEIQNDKDLDENSRLDKFNEAKVLLMHELNSKRKNYKQVEKLWSTGVFETQ